MENKERLEHQKEMMSKLWNEDITTLSNQEIMDLIQNIFYQIFLVEVINAEFKINVDSHGASVRFIIDGIAFGDETNKNSEILEEDTE